MTTLNPFREGSWEYEAYGQVDAALTRWGTLPPSKWAVYNREPLEYLYEEGLHTALFARSFYQTAWTVTDFVKFLAKKQHDYGTQNILKFGAEGIKVRMWDKIARINNLTARNTDAANEPLTDSYTDLAGYVVLFWLVDSGMFEAPLEAEMPTDEGVQEAYMEAIAENPMDMHEIIPTYGDDVYCYYQDSVVLIPNGGIVVKDGIQYPTFTINRTRMI